jgi:dipeptidyl aminopeptidase/acylaminoacyl peptidase
LLPESSTRILAAGEKPMQTTITRPGFTRTIFSAAAILLIIGMWGCAPQLDERDVETPPDPTATATSLPGPTATATIEPSPQVPLSESGPWALILNDDGIWAANGDGSGLTQLNQDVVRSSAVAVSGRWIAYATYRMAESDSESDEGLVLKLLSLPEGQAQTVTGLQIRGVTDESPQDLQYAADQVHRAVIYEGGGLAWSPDGTQLAFVSGHEGTSADVYVLARDTGQITRLTDGPSHAYQLSWSPDGQYIFHTGASNFGSGAGYSMVGVWAARADDTGVRSLYEPDPRSGSEVLVDWISADTVLVHSWRPDCGALTLMRVNVVTGEIRVVWYDYFNLVAYRQDLGAVLVDAMGIRCNPEGVDGFYRIDLPGTGLEQISVEDFYSLLPEPPPDPVPVTLVEDLETLLDIGSLIWVQP